METYGQLRTLNRALQSKDALAVCDDDLLPTAFPLEDDTYVPISYSVNCV